MEEFRATRARNFRRLMSGEPYISPRDEELSKPPASAVVTIPSNTNLSIPGDSKGKVEGIQASSASVNLSSASQYDDDFEFEIDTATEQAKASSHNDKSSLPSPKAADAPYSNVSIVQQNMSKSYTPTSSIQNNKSLPVAAAVMTTATVTTRKAKSPTARVEDEYEVSFEFEDSSNDNSNKTDVQKKPYVNSTEQVKISNDAPYVANQQINNKPASTLPARRIQQTVKESSTIYDVLSDDFDIEVPKEVEPKFHVASQETKDIKTGGATPHVVQSISDHQRLANPATQTVASLHSPSATNMQPQSVANLQPQSVANLQPQSVANLQPQSVANLQSQSIASLQPQSVAGLNPQPVASLQPQSIGSLQPQSIGSLQPQSIGSLQPHSVAGGLQPQSIGSLQPHSVAGGLQPQSIASFQPQSAAGLQTQSVANSQPQSVTSLHPQSSTSLQPQSFADLQPQSITSFQPQSIASFQPQSVASFQPQSIASLHAQNVTSQQTQPVTNVQLQSVASLKPQSVATPQLQSITNLQPQSIAHLQPHTVASQQFQSDIQGTPARSSTIKAHTLNSVPEHTSAYSQPQTINSLHVNQTQQPDVTRIGQTPALGAMSQNHQDFPLGQPISISALNTTPMQPTGSAPNSMKSPSPEAAELMKLIEDRKLLKPKVPGSQKNKDGFGSRIHRFSHSALEDRKSVTAAINKRYASYDKKFEEARESKTKIQIIKKEWNSPSLTKERRKQLEDRIVKLLLEEGVDISGIGKLEMPIKHGASSEPTSDHYQFDDPYYYTRQFRFYQQPEQASNYGLHASRFNQNHSTIPDANQMSWQQNIASIGETSYGASTNKHNVVENALEMKGQKSFIESTSQPLNEFVGGTSEQKVLNQTHNGHLHSVETQVLQVLSGLASLDKPILQKLIGAMGISDPSEPKALITKKKASPVPNTRQIEGKSSSSGSSYAPTSPVKKQNPKVTPVIIERQPNLNPRQLENKIDPPVIMCQVCTTAPAVFVCGSSNGPLKHAPSCGGLAMCERDWAEVHSPLYMHSHAPLPLSEASLEFIPCRARSHATSSHTPRSHQSCMQRPIEGELIKSPSTLGRRGPTTTAEVGALRELIVREEKVRVRAQRPRAVFQTTDRLFI